MDYSLILLLLPLLVLAIGAVWYIVLIIADWKIFVKAGEAGWKSLIPFYTAYIQYKLFWNTCFFPVFLISYLILFIYQLADITSPASALLCIGNSMVSLVLHVISTHKMSKAFGHGIGFTLGLLFFEPVFSMILAFGDSQYQGPQ